MLMGLRISRNIILADFVAAAGRRRRGRRQLPEDFPSIPRVPGQAYAAAGRRG